ncbi:MAG: AarF/ABC1/UbiB kinase family protein [Anaerolineae bacterium]|nr:AarF/ABC1/UbiB kinase family protein [Anaerolineae bacterium]
MPPGDPQNVPFDRRRYLRVVRYFAGAFAHLIFWEIILRGILGQGFVERSAARRWGRLARRYRNLAVELGGVLIKLGQFLSIRVDVLPRVVTEELAGLQDEVLPEDLADIQGVIEAEFGQPIDQVFPWFVPDPEAAASLAQVHRARLLTGDEVVVKIQRPRIDEIVETDLRAIRTATRWLKRYRPISRRVNLDRLYAEFSSTTRSELDFVAEAENAERFALNFADDAHIRIPRVYAQSSTRRVLIMENVASIKITDFEAIEAAGISRQEVARRLFETYLTQVFVHNFVHADPHPGNLFVQPLPPILSDLGLIEPGAGVPFRLTFVDFGMVATIPERVRPHFRDFLVGFVTNDTGRVVRAYQGAGILLPGADLVRLEQVQDEILERYSHLSFQQVQQLAMSEWHSLAHEYRDILYEMPFQIPTDLLFVGRAISILFGMATSLDPDLDPWEAVEPFAREMAADEVKRDWRGWLGELEKMTRLVLSLPGKADRFLSQATRGELMVRTRWSREDTRTVRRVETAVNRLSSAVVFAALLLAAVIVYLAQGGGVVSYLLFALAAAALLASLVRR